MKAFKTHTGEIVKGKKLRKVLNCVADKIIKSAYKIRAQDTYASHVTEQEKDEDLQKDIDNANRIRNPKNIGYELWLFQRIEFELTGKSVPLLP